ncbi:MAG TPA: dihydrolipoyl dehydrogenase [Pseudoclavibacter sp.]|nr:dihydrolipoyl dehydrogenase [Pseudoclavibacter sp.]
MSDSYDVIVVGAGPGGYVAAIGAAQLGLRTAIIEREHLGGVCANWGCIPTKALLHGADVAHSIAESTSLGFAVGGVVFDMDSLVQFSRGVVERLTGGIQMLMDRNGIDVIWGTARLAGKGVLTVSSTDGTGEHTYRASHIILATGARPRKLKGMEFDGERIWSSKEALVPQELPSSILIVGSGAIGSEFASLYRDLGSQVTLVEVVDRILPAEDAETSEFVRKQFTRRGIEVHTKARIDHMENRGDFVYTKVTTSAGEVKEYETARVLVAAGVQPNSEDLGLEQIGVELNRGFVVADQWCRTNVPGLYAIGDLSGAPCLAHKASHEAVICVEKLAGVAGVHPLERDYIPGCTYSRPQVASVGLTEAQAKERGHHISVGRFDLAANGKAIALGDTAGFVKTIFDEDTGELLGAHMVGPEVTEMVQGFSIAHSLEATPEALAATIFPHPSVSESMHESVLAALGQPLNQPPRKKPVRV